MLVVSRICEYVREIYVNFRARGDQMVTNQMSLRMHTHGSSVLI